MSIKLLKHLTFTVGASLIALSSINVAHAFPNLCTNVGGTSVGAPTACADCHTGANPSAGNYTGGCTSMAPPPPPPAPAPAPTPAPTPTPTPAPGGNAGNTGGGAHGMGHRRDDMHRRMRGDDDDRGRFRRHGRDD